MTGHVAALAVGEHEQAGRARVRAGRLEREPAGGAEALEAGELRLDRDAGRAGGVDQRAAVDEHGGGGLRGGGRRARGVGGVGGADERDGEALALHAGVLARSGHRRAGSGSIPRTICDSRAATAAARRSPNAGRR